MGRGQIGRGMGNESAGGHRVGKTPPGSRDESDVANQGDNQMQGTDQRKGQNQRSEMPGETDRTEGVVESFERMDPRRRSPSD